MRSVTLSKVSKGLKPFRRYIDLRTKEYQRYQHRLAKFVFWWNDHVTKGTYEMTYIGSVLRINKIRVICTGVLIDHNRFVIELNVTPCMRSKDIGNGAGASKTIIF